MANQKLRHVATHSLKVASLNQKQSCLVVVLLGETKIAVEQSEFTILYHFIFIWFHTAVKFRTHMTNSVVVISVGTNSDTGRLVLFRLWIEKTSTERSG